MSSQIPIGENALSLIDLWKKNSGTASVVDFKHALNDNYARMYDFAFLIRMDHGVMISTFMGHELKRRESNADDLSSFYLDLFKKEDRKSVFQIYNHAQQKMWGIIGTVERQPKEGRKRFRRSFLSMPIIRDDKVCMFINTDDKQDYRSVCAEKSPPPALSPGETSILEYSFFDPATL